jgi:putative Mg2+ transporter-C (MgtC) family protein
MTTTLASFGEPFGQGWPQVAELAIALVLSSLIGLERQLRHKSAGLRTHALVGLGSALFVLVSKYGFTDVLEPGRIVVDPSRVAAQIVSGIGFIGGGLIFVRRNAVQGLTTAAVVWVTAAVGAACGGGLPVLGAVVTGGHLAIIFGYSSLVRALRPNRPLSSTVRLNYLEGTDTLRRVLGVATAAGFSVTEVHTRQAEGRHSAAVEDEERQPPGRLGSVDVRLVVVGTPPTAELASSLADIDGVLAIDVEGDDDDGAE